MKRHSASLPLVLLLIFAVRIEGQEPAVEITFLDVGQGDAVVVRSPEGRTAMVDAGPRSPLRLLQRLGVETIDLLVATHPHADHIGGMVDVLTARPVRAFMDNGRPHTTATYRRLLATVERLGDLTYLEAVPRTITLGSVAIEVLPLPSGRVDHNDRSVGLVVRFGAFEALLTGDSEEALLGRWVAEGVVPDVELLKAAHHGSVNGFTPAFLEAAQPEVVVISVGADNPYHHPRPEALTAFRSVARRVLRTDLAGHVTVLGFADGSYELFAGDRLDAMRPVPSTALPSSRDPEAGAPAEADDSVTEGSPAQAALRVSVVADAPGDDHGNLNGEYVVIENRGSRRIRISGWRLCDLSSRCFRFPPDAHISPGRAVVVYTGYGNADGTSFFMNNARAVWNNDGDEAILYDAEGRSVIRHAYE